LTKYSFVAVEGTIVEDNKKNAFLWPKIREQQRERRKSMLHERVRNWKVRKKKLLLQYLRRR
jgi:hypothetical protein